MAGSGNAVVDLAAQSLNDLELAHFAEGLDMAAAMQAYAHSGSDAAAKKQAGIALIMKLQGKGQISAWAASNFRAYFNQSPAALIAAHIGNVPTIPTPGDTAKSIGDAAAAAAKGVDLGGFLSALSQPATWLRVAEVVLGIVLIVAGLVKLSPATRNLAAIGKAAALL